MVRHISDKVGVMYLGSMVELAGNHELYDHPLHPYTQALISAIPDIDTESGEEKRADQAGREVPSPIDPPPDVNSEEDAGMRWKSVQRKIQS